MHGDHSEIGGRITLQECQYRRRVDGDPGAPSHCVCDCAGGMPIGMGAEDPRLTDACGACNMPAEIDPLRNRRSCLFLIPVRIWEGGGLRSGFSCRWFFDLKPKKLPRESWLCCLGCPHWFPRPPEEAAIPRMTDWIHRIIKLYWEPEPVGRIWDSPLPAMETDDTLLAQLREKLTMRITKFREAVAARRTRRVSPITQAED